MWLILLLFVRFCPDVTLTYKVSRISYSVKRFLSFPFSVSPPHLLALFVSCLSPSLSPLPLHLSLYLPFRLTLLANTSYDCNMYATLTITMYHVSLSSDCLSFLFLFSSLCCFYVVFVSTHPPTHTHAHARTHFKGLWSKYNK